MAKDRIQVGIVDDHPDFARALERLLRAAGYEPLTYPSGEAFLREFPHPPVDCLLLDIQLGNMTGLEVALQLANGNLRVPIIFMTAYDSRAAREAAQTVGCAAYLEKPFASQSLFEAIRQVTAGERGAGTGGDPLNPNQPGSTDPNNRRKNN